MPAAPNDQLGLASLPHAVLVDIAQLVGPRGCGALRASCRTVREAHDEATTQVTLLGHSALAASPRLLQRLPQVHSITAECIGGASLAPLSQLTQLESVEVQPWDGDNWQPDTKSIHTLLSEIAPNSIEALSTLTPPTSPWLAPLTALQSLQVTGRTPSQVLGSAPLPSLTSLSLNLKDRSFRELTDDSLARLTGLSSLTLTLKPPATIMP